MKNDESSSPLLEIIPNNGENHGTTRPRITGLGWFGIWWRMMGVHGLVLPFEWKWKQILWYPAEELLLSAGGHRDNVFFPMVITWVDHLCEKWGPWHRDVGMLTEALGLR